MRNKQALAFYVGDGAVGLREIGQSADISMRDAPGMSASVR
jgi:hypothetical protein